MTFAGTGFTPKWECGTYFLLIITKEFVQKESDTINTNMNKKKRVLMKYHVLGIDTTHGKNTYFWEQETPDAVMLEVEQKWPNH